MDKTKMYFWDVLALLIIVLIVNVIFFVMPLLSHWKSSFVSARTIMVSAQGLATVTPDMAEISFSVLSQGQDPKTLSNDNNTKMSAVLAFVSSQKIASSDIATTAYDLQPNYTWNKYTNRSDITGYTLTQTVQVKIRDLTQVATVLSGLAPLGVNQIGGVDFTFQDPDKFIALARADALRKARAEAADMAAQAGASLGEVVNIGESSYIPYYAKSYNLQSMGAGDVAAPTAPPIAPGTQDVTDQVNVTYTLN